MLRVVLCDSEMEGNFNFNNSQLHDTKTTDDSRKCSTKAIDEFSKCSNDVIEDQRQLKSMIFTS